MTIELRFRAFWQAARGAAARLNRHLSESGSEGDMIFQTRHAPVETRAPAGPHPAPRRDGGGRRGASA